MNHYLVVWFLVKLKTRDVSVDTHSFLIIILQSHAAILSLRCTLSQAAVAVSCFLTAEERQRYDSERLIFSFCDLPPSRVPVKDRYHSFKCACSNKEEMAELVHC